MRKPVACQIVPIEVSVTGRVGGKLDRDHDSKVRYLPSLHGTPTFILVACEAE